jgi:PAS domain S-box-containing protein
MREHQGQLIATMATADNRLSESAEHVDQVIKDQLQRTGLMVGTLALTILVGLVMASTRLLVRHVRSPMAAIQAGIANFSKGHLETPIDLNRQDEWAIIEGALNRMAQDLKASYTALEISEESYRGIFENVNEGIYQSETTARGSHFTKANPALARLLAHESPQEVIQAYDDLSTQLFVDPGDHERLLGVLRREKSVSGFEYQLKDSSGRLLWVAISANLTADDGNRHLTLEGTMLDISVRKRAEEEMRRLRKLLKNITDSMPSVLVAVDAQGCVTHWNREAERLTGTLATEAQGRPLGDVFPQIANQEVRIKEAIAQRPFEPQVTVTNIINAKEVINDITVYPLAADGIAGAVIRIDDVTDRMRMKEMMIQSEKMLSVGGLAAGMAHEINNPLAGILQNVQVIENRLLKDLPKNRRTAGHCGIELSALGRYLEARGVPGMLSAVRDSGERAARIVDNMLSFARKDESERSSNDMATLMDRTIELAHNDYDLKRKLDFRHIRLVKAYDASLPPIHCNSSKIQQVLLNLFRNGAQAMTAHMKPSEGEDAVDAPQFTLRIQRAGEMARIEVEDNGPGMDEATRKRVFEPFFTTKGVGIGTGLGLSVSYFIITENHKGRMSVTSQLGKGSTFRIELPINPS